jgi:hypothetical protein
MIVADFSRIATKIHHDHERRAAGRSKEDAGRRRGSARHPGWSAGRIGWRTLNADVVLAGDELG